MKTYAIKITQTAKGDLSGIFRYIKNIEISPDAAKEQLLRIRAAVHSLSSHPHRFILLPEEHFPGVGIRRAPVDNFLIFYSVDKESENVFILRVLHSRRNWLSLLSL